MRLLARANFDDGPQICAAVRGLGKGIAMTLDLGHDSARRFLATVETKRAAFGTRSENLLTACSRRQETIPNGRPIKYFDGKRAVRQARALHWPHFKNLEIPRLAPVLPPVFASDREGRQR